MDVVGLPIAWLLGSVATVVGALGGAVGVLWRREAARHESEVLRLESAAHSDVERLQQQLAEARADVQRLTELRERDGERERATLERVLEALATGARFQDLLEQLSQAVRDSSDHLVRLADVVERLRSEVRRPDDG